MIRVLTVAMLLVSCVTLCFAQNEKEQAATQAAKSLEFRFGDQYVVTAPIFVTDRAANPADKDSLQLAKLLEAGDQKGVALMVKKNRAFQLPANTQITVLEASFEKKREDKSSYCSVYKDGIFDGYYLIHDSWFTTATMKKGDADDSSIALRVWSTTDSRYRIEAVFISFAAGKVKLMKKGGSTIDVDFDKLSEADRKWVEKKK